jgi:hypothetical protein
MKRRHHPSYIFVHLFVASKGFFFFFPLANLFSQLENFFYIFIPEWLEKIVFFGFYLVAKFHFYYYYFFFLGGRRGNNCQISLIGSSIKCEGWLKVFFFLSYPLYSQIWLNCCMDDHHISYITKVRKKKGGKKNTGSDELWPMTFRL